jgi:ATP adenylyltransferase
VRQSDDRANLLLARGRTCGIVLNRYPYNNGHLMVFPFRHVSDLAVLKPGERRELMDLVCQSVETLRAALSAEGFNAGVNLGKAAGAGLAEHVHVHVVPRWNGDTNFMPAVGETKVIPQSLLDLWDRLRPLFSPAGRPWRAAGRLARKRRG